MRPLTPLPRGRGGSALCEERVALPAELRDAALASGAVSDPTVFSGQEGGRSPAASALRSPQSHSAGLSGACALRAHPGVPGSGHLPPE